MSEQFERLRRRNPKKSKPSHPIDNFPPPDSRAGKKKPPQDKQEFNGTAAVMSFLIPGLGQVYCGEVLIGILLLISTIIGLFFFILPGLAIWIYAIVDAGNR